MSTYSVRCKDGYCRHRRVLKRHPDTYVIVPKCAICGQRKGWRIEPRGYNKADMCSCGQSPLYPHRVGKYKFCDHHPQGFYNQAKRRGVADDDIPLEVMGRTMKETDVCPF